MDEPIYKILTRNQWETFREAESFTGAPVDLADGYIHFSTAKQVRETAAKHFSGQSGLVLARVNTDSFGDRLKWEISRGGQRFPHLYAALPLANVETVYSLELGDDGVHIFPADLPE